MDDLDYFLKINNLEIKKLALVKVLGQRNLLCHPFSESKHPIKKKKPKDKRQRFDYSL